MTIRVTTADDRSAVDKFVLAIPEAERSFYKEDAGNEELGSRWSTTDPLRLIKVGDDGTVHGLIRVRRGQGQSSHVGEIMLVVHPAHRRAGAASALVKAVVVEGMKAGLTHIFVEVTAAQTATIGMFQKFGFTGEALLRGFIKDGSGELHDLIMMTHRVEENWAAANAIGLDVEGELS